MVLEHISEILNANSCLPDAVQFKNDKFPEVFVNGVWLPICGHWFWDNYYGAGLFCQKLTSNVHSTGKVIRRTDKPLESDGIRIGTCLIDDKWGSCTGGYNDHETGQDPGCAAGQPASIEIMCSHGKTESVLIALRRINNTNCEVTKEAIPGSEKYHGPFSLKENKSVHLM